MISIHADAVKQREVTGASVYTLSEKGASDRVAARLARKENNSDAVGGVMPGEVEDPLVQSILADLIKRDSLNSAEMLAEQILRHIGQVGPVKYNAPKHARFVVLTAAEIPSVLVELDYISNPERERLLKTASHQKRLATALLDASRTFLRKQGRLPSQVGSNKELGDAAQMRLSSSSIQPAI
jgi:N-acetylmuramoyl-L-alanine amidase